MPLSLTCETVLQRLFKSEDQADARKLLDTPFDEAVSERVALGILKISQGDLYQLLEAVDLAQADWRDLLVAAGFAESLTAHTEWTQQVLSE